MKISSKMLVLFFTIIFLQNIYASENITPTLVSKTQYLKLDKIKQKTVASMWGLTTEEYADYLQIMQNSPSGKWYQNLNPAEVLGINAKTDSERIKYAKIVVQNTYQRTSKELAFQKAYDKAWKILYPNLKPIEPKQTSHVKSFSLVRGDTLFLITPINNSTTTAVIPRLIALSKSRTLNLNIYITGKHTDKEIQTWASKNAIPIKLVNEGLVTLNHAFGNWNQQYSSNSILILQRAGQSHVVPFEALERLT